MSPQFSIPQKRIPKDAIRTTILLYNDQITVSNATGEGYGSKNERYGFCSDLDFQLIASSPD